MMRIPAFSSHASADKSATFVPHPVTAAFGHINHKCTENKEEAESADNRRSDADLSKKYAQPPTIPINTVKSLLYAISSFS